MNNEKNNQRGTNQSNRDILERNVRVTNRLMCDDCYKTVCCYSFMTTERKFVEQLGNVLCEECAEKSAILFTSTTQEKR